MADADTSYGSVTAITCSVDTVPLANGNTQQSTAWNATTGNVLDMLLRVKTKGQASGVDYCYVYTYGSLETSTQVYTDGASGTDSAYTASSTNDPLNSPLVGAIQMDTTTSVTAGPWSLAAAWGGFLPQYVGILFRNESGAAMSSTGADHDFDYLPVYVTSA